MFDRYMDSGEAGTAAKKSMTLMVSVIIHVALIVSVIVLPLLFPDTVSGSIQRLSFLVTPPLPPAPPPAPPPEAVARRIPSTVVRDAFQAPVEIPKEILIGMDEAPPPTRSSRVFRGVFQEEFLVACPVASLMESSGGIRLHWILFHSRRILRQSSPLKGCAWVEACSTPYSFDRCVPVTRRRRYRPASRGR